ncbi:MAG: hypothetical protein A2020_08690 [Lentisphaerae bacterium GWF2_45_14]|nr:MAG: hypothetical protein A2020_08690 [Lentisphaerae bacterium GWF2_45_14]
MTCGAILIFLAILVFLGLCVFFILSAVSNSSQISSIFKINPYGSYQEVFVDGDDLSMNKIAVIDVKGVIVDGESSFYSVADATRISDQIKYIIHDGNVKAVVLDIDSPGGEVVASDSIHHELGRLRQETGIPIVAVMRSLGASGAYYIAAGSDYIIANRMTITGSIGVIIETYKYHELFKKIGVEGEVFKSGAMKDILNGARPSTPQEKAVVQNLVGQTYSEFVQIVANGRKNLSGEKIKTSIIGDGRIFDGAEAHKLGLVDQLGFFEDAVEKAAELANVGSDYKAVRYEEPFSFGSLFRSSEASSSNLSISLGNSAKSFSLEKGRLYFLPGAFY